MSVASIHHPRAKGIEDCRGYVLITSLIMLVVLSLLGAVVMNLSGADLQAAAYEKMSTQAFFAAESGITQARNDMQTFVASLAQQGQWPANDVDVINAVTGGVGVPKANPPGPFTFTYTIADIGPANDRTVLVTATGVVRNVQQVVEGVVRYEPPAQVGSQECVTASCTGFDQSSGSTVVNNENSTVTL